jgi:hypothetical protein
MHNGKLLLLFSLLVDDNKKAREESYANQLRVVGRSDDGYLLYNLDGSTTIEMANKGLRISGNSTKSLHVTIK